MRPDLPEWGESGYDLWFREGFVSEEVRLSLENIVKNRTLEALMETEELREIFMPKERILWVRKKKLQEAYFFIRAEYIKLLLKDFEQMMNEIIERERERISKPSEGEEESKPINFDDLPPEIQEEIINQLLEQIQEGELGRPPLSEDDREGERIILSLGQEAIENELRERRQRREEGKPLGREERETETEQILRGAMEQLERARYMRQIHEASEMERASLLGLSLEQLRAFEKKKKEMELKINSFADFLYKNLRRRIEPELKTHQPWGHLMPGRLPDYIRGRKRGEEPLVFQEIGFESVMPAIDVLFLVDHSGSMGILDKNKKAAEVVLLFSEALKIAERKLNATLPKVRKRREYLRLGLITFSDKAILRKPLETPLDDRTNAQIFFTTEDISGGGTADAEALRNLIKYLKEQDTKYRGRCKVLKLVVIVTDGQGEREKVRDVLSAAKTLKHTIFVVVGAGSDTEDVLDTYGKELKGVRLVLIHIPDKELNQMAQIIIRKLKKPLLEEISKL
jgi:uncharacterized protein YegL